MLRHGALEIVNAYLARLRFPVNGFGRSLLLIAKLCEKHGKRQVVGYEFVNKVSVPSFSCNNVENAAVRTT